MMKKTIENINEENVTVDYNEYELLEVESVGKEEYSGKVYDLEVKNIPNYTVESSIIAHNGGGKRRGSISTYISPHHPDIFDFLDLRKNNGAEEMRARDLNLALWCPELFFTRVKNDEHWTLMDPAQCPGLSDAVGEDFNKLYIAYEEAGKGKRIKAKELWSAMLQSQIETGQPYILNSDSANLKSNQKNLGTIKSSNLCVSGDTEIVVASDESLKDIKTVTIKDFCESFDKTKTFFVKSYDEKTQTVKFSKVLNAAMTNPRSDVIIFRTGEKHVVCTEDHQILTDRGYVKAKEVFGGDIIQQDGITSGLVTLERLFAKIPVYDLTVEDTHNFYANGIVVHNCAEIIEYSNPEETAVCNLASVSLTSCVEGKKHKKVFNFDKLYTITKQLTYNLNNVIDNNFYPVETAENSNLKHRPIGIGIQGLADAFALMRYNWDSQEAKDLNIAISETMYYAALEASSELAAKEGSYSSFKGSPASEGLLQFDLWNHTPTERYDWDKLKAKIKKNGLRNSLLIALMPTASTSQILGNTECFEPITSNIYKRETLSGSFTMVNKYLVDDLIDLELWNDNLKDKIIARGGSIQDIEEIPADIKQLYRTVWELSQKVLIDLSADRGPFVCQSQSLNLFFKTPNFAKLSSAYMYANQKGLKTLVYYTRSQAAREAVQVTISKDIEDQMKAQKDQQDAEDLQCSLENPEACEACSG